MKTKNLAIAGAATQTAGDIIMAMSLCRDNEHVQPYLVKAYRAQISIALGAFNIWSQGQVMMEKPE